MLSSKDIKQSALREISTRRQVARTKAIDEKNLLEKAYPELKQAEKNLQDCGIMLNIAVISEDGTAENARNKLALAQQNYASVLAKLGRPADALEPKFTCKICDDTGYVDGNTCNCVHELMQKMRRKEIEDKSSLSITHFNALNLKYYPDKKDPLLNQNIRQYMGELIADLTAYAEDFDKNSANLLLFGNSGLGKTHVALAIAGVALSKGFDVVYLSAPEFFSKIEHYHFNNQPELESTLIETVTNADLLILDDLGTELISAFTISTLYTLLNARMANKSPTIFTSNITDGAILEKRYTEKISSRISGSCEPFRFMGDDVRHIKAME